MAEKKPRRYRIPRVQLNTNLYLSEAQKEGLKEAIKYDFLATQGQPDGMKKETIYEWIRLLVRKRIQAIINDQKWW